MRRTIAAVAASAVAALPLLVSTPAQAADDATVVLVHGVPGLTVDVYGSADTTYSPDEALLKDFAPGTVTDPVTLPGGTYNLAVFPAGDAPTGTPAIEAKDVTVPAGANISVVAHLTADGTPTLTPYVNDVKPVAAGQARLVVRHDAAAPAVDILAGGTPVFTGLANPDEKTADLPAGSVSAAVALAGTTDPVIGPADLDLAEGTSTIVYAWGSAADGNLALAVQTIGGLHSAPSGVPSGTADLPADRTPVLLGGIAALALLAAATTALKARRVRA
ncbi:DUF4397 domain-containing protein [Phycicoccus sp.]|uniref:DUF4397 domain-containing protein n=1 Tax=Phycicoccus sp. TaxID=1902410 RepID=UPI002CB1DCD9|nr:DUF4397 domain-containing protein [Phycicoccus sp.]HMM96818.1 DUF4397 domain-containing protein [Phycicoccus sp.]